MNRRSGSKRFLWVCLAATGVMLPGCSRARGMRIHSYQGLQMRSYAAGEAYSWAPRPQPRTSTLTAPDEVNPELDEVVRTLIDSNLAAKGYPKKNLNERPAFWVHYRAGRQVKQAETGHESWDEGSLAVDVLDPESGDLIWCGLAEARIDYSAAPDVRKQRLEEAVRKIMETFPVKKGA